MTIAQRLTSVGVALSIGFGAIVAPGAAMASEEGKKNTALGIGAAAAALLLTQKNKLPGIVAAAGAAYAYKKYDDDVRSRHRRENDYGYDYRRDDRYNNKYENNYRYNRDNYDRNDRYNRDNYDSNYRYNSDYRNRRDGDGPDCVDRSYRRSSRR